MNQRRYWLRGGIIASVIGVVLSLTLSVFLLVSSAGAHTAETVGALISTVFLFISSFIIFFHLTSFGFFGVLLAVCVPCFIVGAVIGSFYGKIKNRNKVNS